MYKSLLILLDIFRMIAIPVQFQDREFTVPQEDIAAGASRVESYLNDQFRQSRTFQIDLAPVTKISASEQYYGKNSPDRKDEKLRELVIEACNASKTAVDYSLYDNDGDGTVDMVLLITAGLSEADGAGEDRIWPQESMLENMGGTVSVSGKRINTFVVCPELKSDGGENPRMMGIGTVVHEISHTFGLMDMYDTDGELSGGLSKGLWGTLSVMDHGLENDNGNTPPFYTAIELDQLGLGICDTLRKGTYTLPPSGREGRFLKMFPRNGSRNYLLEYRKAESWDSFIGGSGLIVYSVDRSRDYAGYSDYYHTDLRAFERWERNQVNCNPAFQCATIEAADTSITDVSGVFLPRKGVSSIPLPPLAITNIAVDGDNMTFDVIEPVTMQETVCFQDAAILNWTVSDAIEESRCFVNIRPEGSSPSEETDRFEVKVIRNGIYSLTVEGLSPRTEYRASIHVMLGDGKEFTRHQSFKTKSYSPGVLPFIYLNSAERGNKGTFIMGSRIPLRVYNAPDASSVEWYFNDVHIQAERDGYYRITRSGTLKAEVHYEDGSMDAIEKKITIE